MFVTTVPQYIQGVLNAKVDLNNATGTGVVLLYTAPSDATFNSSIIHSILVSNDDASNADTITVIITNTDDAVFSLFKVKAVAAKTTIELLTKDLILNSGEKLSVQCATVDRLHVVASIQELAYIRTVDALM